ncbi:MAG: CapA family protein [Pseudomonadota bacterium]
MQSITLFLGGDVMTGRGIDQILPHPCVPDLYERWVQHADDYVELAERRSGPVPRPAGFDYIWGDALEELGRRAPDLRIVNLETSITTSPRYQADKGIHYRMNPRNVPCLTAAGIDCCVLANNHVLDWGVEGLLETLGSLEGALVDTTGAGRHRAAAARPAILPLPGGIRLLVFAYAMPSSGVPATWAATEDRPGVNLLRDASPRSVDRVAADVDAHRRAGDLVLISVHWGGNWGYAIPDEHVTLARALVDRAGVNAVHGHSSHHPLAVEIHRNRPLIYGCGDLLNDYEGIRGYEAFRSDLTFMYFPVFDPRTGELTEFTLTPMRICRFRLNRCTREDVAWLQARLAEQSRAFGVGVVEQDGRLALRWGADG